MSATTNVLNEYMKFNHLFNADLFSLGSNLIDA